MNLYEFSIQTINRLQSLGARIISTVWIPDANQIGYILFQNGRQSIKTPKQILSL